MANPNPSYSPPLWQNDSVPALNATNMQNISDAIEELQRNGIGTARITLSADGWNGGDTFPDYAQLVPLPSIFTNQSFVFLSSDIFEKQLKEIGATGFSVERIATGPLQYYLSVHVYGAQPYRESNLVIAAIG